MKIFLLLIILVGISGGGWFYYNKYKMEKLKRIAEEERKRQEELEKEKERKFLEEKKKEFEELLSQIEEYYKKGNYKKVKELADKALNLAKQFNFTVDRINEILYKMNLNIYLSKLKKLEKENEDIYKYFYVRSEVLKIPSLSEINSLKNRIINKTYENEYKVKLITAEKSLDELKKGEEVFFNYELSKKMFSEAKNLRERKNIARDDLEDKIQTMQNDLYFASKILTKKTIPSSIN